MAGWKKLPGAAENAIAAAVREVVDAGGDPLVCDAIVAAIKINLYGADFELRPGFGYDALGKLDFSGVDKLAALKAANGKGRLACDLEN